MQLRTLIACLALTVCSLPAAAEDGYDLWLRYRAVDAAVYPALDASARGLVRDSSSPTLSAAGTELERGLSGLLGRPIPILETANQPGAIIFGTPGGSRLIANLSLPLERAGPSGYVIRSVRLDDKPVIVIAANSDIGVLYGAFHFLRLVQTGQRSMRSTCVRSRA